MKCFSVCHPVTNFLFLLRTTNLYCWILLTHVKIISVSGAVLIVHDSE